MTNRIVTGRWKMWLFFVAVLFIVLIIRILAKPASPEAGTPSQVVSGSFTPTQNQWEALKTTKVMPSAFRSETQAEGKIAANGDRTTPVFSPYSGRVSKVIARLGDNVTKGAPLFEIEAIEFSQGQNDLVAALSTVSTSRSQEHIAEVKEQRQHALYEAKAAAKQDWEQSQIDLEAARNTLRSAEVALSLAKNKLHLLGNSDDEVSALENAKKMNGKTMVQSPITGTVIDRQAAQGQFINSLSTGATTPVYTIGDLATAWLIANVAETDAGSVHVGDDVNVHVLAFPAHTFSAKLAYVAPSVDVTTHRLLVRAEVDNSEGLLKPEMFASFSILDGETRNAPGIPENAVVYEGDKAHVWLVNPDHTIAIRDIRIGQIQNGTVEVTDGLKAGDVIVTSGALFIDRAVKSE